GHRGVSVLVFEASVDGLLQAEQLCELFQADGRGRQGWIRRTAASLVDKSGKRNLFAYMAQEGDVAEFNRHSKGKTQLRVEVKKRFAVVDERLRAVRERAAQAPNLEATVAMMSHRIVAGQVAASQLQAELEQAKEANRKLLAMLEGAWPKYPPQQWAAGKAAPVQQLRSKTQVVVQDGWGDQVVVADEECAAAAAVAVQDAWGCEAAVAGEDCSTGQQHTEEQQRVREQKHLDEQEPGKESGETKSRLQIEERATARNEEAFEARLVEVASGLGASEQASQSIGKERGVRACLVKVLSLWQGAVEAEQKHWNELHGLEAAFDVQQQQVEGRLQVLAGREVEWRRRWRGACEQQILAMAAAASAAGTAATDGNAGGNGGTEAERDTADIWGAIKHLEGSCEDAVAYSREVQRLQQERQNAKAEAFRHHREKVLALDRAFEAQWAQLLARKEAQVGMPEGETGYGEGWLDEGEGGGEGEETVCVREER
ncbi:unnamed protein product, partial [Closterium sp. Naga37s-1]